MDSTPTTKLRIAVLVSGGGTNLQAMIDAIAQGRIHVEIAVVVSNRKGAGALKRAQQAQIPTATLSHRDYGTREAFDTNLADIVNEFTIDYVVLAGFMRLLTPSFLERFEGRVVNIHPALLPAFPGVNAEGQAWEYGTKLAGCTVHFVDQSTDGGPIIAQVAVPVCAGEGYEALRERVRTQEHRIYPWVLQLLAEGRVTRGGADGRQVVIDTPVRGATFALSSPPMPEGW